MASDTQSIISKGTKAAYHFEIILYYKLKYFAA